LPSINIAFKLLLENNASHLLEMIGSNALRLH